MNRNLVIGTEVTLSINSMYHAEFPGPWNPKGEIGFVHSQRDNRTYVRWHSYVAMMNEGAIQYNNAGVDLIPVWGMSTREQARNVARSHNLTVVDLGSDLEQRWQVAVKEI